MRVRAHLDSLDERVLTWLNMQLSRRPPAVRIPEPAWVKHAETTLGRLDNRFYALQASSRWPWVVFVGGLLALLATVLLLALGQIAAWSLGMIGVCALVLAGGELRERNGRDRR